MIYNEDTLLGDPDNKKVLEDYREKVIDREFKLDPTVEENLDFIFNGHPDVGVIKEVFVTAGTNNIRVIRKTKWLIDELIPLMENWEASLRNQVIKNSIVINLAKLDTEFRQRFSITIDTILPSRNSSKSKDTDNKTFERERQAIQQKYYLGYSDLEEIDELIIQLVDTPLSKSAELEFSKKGDILNQREQNTQIIQKFHNISELCSSSFADNEEEIMNQIITFLEEHHLDLSISQFEQIQTTASFLERDRDIDKYEKSLLEHILKTLKLDNFNDLDAMRAKLFKYPELEAHLEDKKDEYQQSLDIPTALRNIINRDSESISSRLGADIEFLNSLSVEEYSKWLQEGHPNLGLIVKMSLKLDNLPASKKLEQAIRILAQKTKLNKIRAKSLYNIDIDNPSNTNEPNTNEPD
ncbi:hypothetical protein Cylst_1753 [Cylindrospermum stagnale PCC 7417]|uniref:Uncharacterized protein n=1 Tax=Cylindrospermum stagnale PCC 7417 TaxID=56107 RepID=K9WW28_9NOST|nr:hypothetical protein [Cylindrospermum stagnale]AFZ24024.1 hypothetical protein Cylst_1753 [Cylindrospermum stagnale PCC 7417]